MKKYYIYLSDTPQDPIKGIWKNKTEARKDARLYIKQWKLKATILRIEEIEEVKSMSIEIYTINENTENEGYLVQFTDGVVIKAFSSRKQAERYATRFAAANGYEFSPEW